MSTNLFYIGPVVVDLGDPSDVLSTAPLNARGAELSGETDWDAACQLNELVANEDAKQTVGGTYGVLLPVFIDHPDFWGYSGWYVFTNCEVTADWTGELADLVPIRLSATYLGDAPDLVVSRTSVPKDMTVDVSPSSIVVGPFHPEDASGDTFVVAPGGTFATRPYDPRHPFDPTSPTPEESATVGFYVGTVTETTDDLSAVCFPRVTWTKDAPRWLTNQGGMVRARDRRTRREVYGPHPFLEATDLWVGNGLIAFWVGNRGLVPFLNVQAFDGTSWVGNWTVQLGPSTSAVLRRARLIRITADDAVVALTADGYGDILVTLKRGERVLRFELPSGGLRPAWSGMPPGSATSAVNDAGKFGRGLGAGRGGAHWDDAIATWDDLEESWDGSFAFSEPNVRLLWPPEQAQDEWGIAWWIKPYEPAAATGDAGYLTIYDDADEPVALVYLDRTDQKVKFTMAGTTVASAAQTFAADDDLQITARFSTTNGMALSVRSQSGTVVHYTNPAQTSKGTSGKFASLVFYGIQHATVDLYPADDTYPASDLYPGSLVWGDGTPPSFIRYADAVVDNVMIFDGWPSNERVVALAGATSALDGLDEDEPMLVWWAPFDAIPIPTFGVEANGRSAASVAEWGFTPVVAVLDPATRTSAAAYLATDGELDTVADVHAQSAAESSQEVRVRA